MASHVEHLVVSNRSRSIRLLVLLLLLGQVASATSDTQTGLTGGNPVIENRQPGLTTRYMISLSAAR